MGIGDEVPAGIAQRGGAVTLLGDQDLATGDLRQYEAIMTGTRAYAVREDLKTYNRRLLDYVKAGGNLIVLYNTQELVPDLYAPYPGKLSAGAEEVSEEDSPVEILAPDDPVLATPNRITKADFDNWVEQRGSKFWDAWDPRYPGQDPGALGRGRLHEGLAAGLLRQLVDPLQSFAPIGPVLFFPCFGQPGIDVGRDPGGSCTGGMVVGRDDQLAQLVDEREL